MTDKERPLIQIDDLVRPMTDEELADYEAFIANSPALPASGEPS